MTTFISTLSAKTRITPYLESTLLEPALSLSPNLYFKLENTNPTHSFKIRGALNAILGQSDIAREQGIIAASAGNHAMGIAYGAKLINTPAKIVMPKSAPQRKVKGVESLGATAVLYGNIYDEAELHGRELEKQGEGLFISAYNDPYVIAGQGTISHEIFTQLPTTQRIIVPTSGGGLLAGVALAAKHINPSVEIIGVQSIATPAMYNVFYDTNYPQLDTLADGLAGEIEDGSITVPICKQYTDKIVLVEEDTVADGVRWMFQNHGWAIEGAAAVGTAAILSNVVDINDGKDTVVIISGGNIDADKFLKLMEDVS